MADNPDIQWALDILTPDPDFKASLFTEYGFQVSTSVSFFLGVCAGNYMVGRPRFAGFHIHIITSLLGWVAGAKCKDAMDNHYARRDQKLRHYIMLHPEDFPKPERKKWSEVLEPWYPMR